MTTTRPFYILFQVLGLLLMTIYKRCSHQFFYLFLFYISFYIFHDLLELHSTLPKKDFLHEVYFFNGFTQTESFFCRCFLNYIQITMVSCQNTSKLGSNPSLVFPRKAISEIADILWKNAPDGVQHENKLKY